VLTIHAADALRRTWESEPVADGAVAVEGDRIAAVGTRAELTARYPTARVRHWSGTLGPGLTHEGPLPDAPSPRERVHEVLKRGAVAVTAAHTTPELRTAAARTGVTVLPAPRPPAPLTAGHRADLAVFANVTNATNVANVTYENPARATICAGRLVHRRT
jgi:hypothetical protein